MDSGLDKEIASKIYARNSEDLMPSPLPPQAMTRRRSHGDEEELEKGLRQSKRPRMEPSHREGRNPASTLRNAQAAAKPLVTVNGQIPEASAVGLRSLPPQ